MRPERRIYLDYNATAAIRPDVIAVMADIMARPANPSSVHGFGRAARKLLEESRRTIAAAVGAEPGDVIFTSGGTEANNLALRSVPGAIAVSRIEHPSVRNVRSDAQLLPVTRQGLIDCDAAAKLIADAQPALVSVMLANNETGCIQPVADIAAIARRYHALLHVDAVQALGKIPVDRDALGADYLAVSAHKIGGPQGVGALIVREGAPLTPAFLGGAQEQRRRAGTENVAAIVGFTRALELAFEDDLARLAAWRDELEHQALEAMPAAIVIGAETCRLPNTSALALPGVRSDIQLMRLDLDGIAVSTGSACSSGKVGTSHVLEAMQISPEIAGSTIRVSLGWQTSEDDIASFVASWRRLADLAGRPLVTT